MGQGCGHGCIEGGQLNNLSNELKETKEYAFAMPGSPEEIRELPCDPSNLEDWRRTYRPEFVNGMIQAVWPSIEAFSKKMVREVVEPAVKRSLGKFGQAFSIDYDNYSIGKTPFKFGPMQISESTQLTSDGTVEPIMVVRSKFEFEGQLKIYVIMNSLKCGLTRLQMTGDLIMEMVGRTPKPPLFQGARACFMNPPKLEIKYDVGVLNQLLRIAPIDKMLQAALEDQVAAKLVVPNRMGVRLDPACEMFRILKPRPKGLLKLTILGCKNLKAQDMAVVSTAASDPFVRIKCGALKFESEVKKSTVNPVFDWAIVLPIDLPSEQMLHLDIYDKDTITADDFLGALWDQRVSDIINWGPNKEVTIDIHDEDRTAGKHGQIRMKSEWRQLVLPDQKTTCESMLRSPAAVVFVGIYLAKRLPCTATPCVYWVEMQCTNRLGLSGSSTSKAYKTPKQFQDDGGSAAEFDEHEERKILQAKRALCEKYKMSKVDMAKMLDTDVANLDLPTELSHHELPFNYAVDFFVHTLPEAEVTITLMKSEGRTKSFISLQSTDGEKVHAWKVPVREIAQNEVKHHRAHHVLEIPNSNASLHARLQVRCLGDPCTTFT